VISWWENTASGPPFTSTAQELNPGKGMRFIKAAWPASPMAACVRAFNSVYDGTLFQLQPYAANNALVLSSGTGLTSGTLTLTTTAVLQQRRCHRELRKRNLDQRRPLDAALCGRQLIPDQL